MAAANTKIVMVRSGHWEKKWEEIIETPDQAIQPSIKLLTALVSEWSKWLLKYRTTGIKWNQRDLTFKQKGCKELSLFKSPASLTAVTIYISSI